MGSCEASRAALEQKLAEARTYHTCLLEMSNQFAAMRFGAPPPIQATDAAGPPAQEGREASEAAVEEAPQHAA